MDLNIDEIIAQRSPVYGSKPPVTQNGRSGRQLPTRRLEIPGFSPDDYDACIWVAPPGSGNAGQLYGGVFRIGKSKSGKRKTYRTFPALGGGLFANLLGTCELLSAFAMETSIDQATRDLYQKVSVDVTAAVVRHLAPKSTTLQQQAAAQPSLPTTADELVAAGEPGF